MPSFRIWFSGLCHFVQNEDPNTRCRICVVIPKASGEQDKNDHEVKVSYVVRVQKRGRRVIDHDPHGRIGDLLNRHRVAFDVKRSEDAEPLPVLEVPHDEETFFFRLGEIVGIYADKDPSLVSSDPAASVAAQVLLDQGVFGFDERLSIVRPWEVTDLDGNVIERNVADPVYVEIADVESVAVIITSMDGSEGERFELEQNVGDNFEIIVGARCDNGESGVSLELREEPNRIVLVQVDYDFGFHYNLLHESSVGALNGHPHIQERMMMQSSAVPIPESIMLELFLSPFLENALRAPETPSESDSDVEAKAGTLSDNSTETHDAEAGSGSIGGLLLRGNVSALETISKAPAIVEIFEALKVVILSSGATCDCLACDGRPRVFNLDRYLPPAALGDDPC